MHIVCVYVFLFKVTATTEIYTYCHTRSLHYALPISHGPMGGGGFLSERQHARLRQRGERCPRPLSGLPQTPRASRRGVTRFGEITCELHGQAGTAVP